MKLKFISFCFLAALGTNISAADNDYQVIKDSFKSVFPSVEVTGIRPAPLDNMYEVTVGGEILYVSADGKYIMRGDIIDAAEKRNLTEEQRSLVRVNLLNGVPKKDVIEFPASKPEHTIFVFTDTSCGYCRRLHQDVPELNRRGVSVRYFAYPRAGLDSPTATQLQSVWCADDRNQALTDAKAGKTIEEKQCDNPVAAQFELGRQIGIRGTPAIYLENGKALPGYLPPNQLIQAASQ